MTCEGWGAAGFSLLGACSMAWIVIAILVFLALIARRQAEDGILAGMGYNIFGAMGVGLGAAIVIITLFGNSVWALIFGVVGIAAGGFGIGLITGSSEGEGE